MGAAAEVAAVAGAPSAASTFLICMCVIPRSSFISDSLSARRSVPGKGDRLPLVLRERQRERCMRPPGWCLAHRQRARASRPLADAASRRRRSQGQTCTLSLLAGCHKGSPVMSGVTRSCRTEPWCHQASPVTAFSVKAGTRDVSSNLSSRVRMPATVVLSSCPAIPRLVPCWPENPCGVRFR